eukprot:TRINITY_DN10047_c0_g1_i1.p1 TRINITY_DN10047_c0_g1~~TRINITY_DN10047_c0_g1_i1.p1  ORF type:complete len:155 (-),score=23.48 TRINITY_DN10047_c0_g1_i1:87-551(-)
MVGDHASVVHLNGNYWETTTRTGSHFPECIHLKSVCWGEWQVNIDGVEAGDYDVLIRMAWDTKDYRKVETPTYTIRDQSQTIKSVVLDSEIFDQMDKLTSDWFILKLCRITIPNNGKISVGYVGHYGYWFGGWWIDWVALTKPDIFNQTLTQRK